MGGKEQISKKRLEDYFKREKVNTRELFNELSLFIYSVDDPYSDLHILARILPDDVLYKLISHYNGGIIKIPTKDKFKESLVLALVYYFYEVKKLPWAEIKEILGSDTKPFESYSFISLAKRVKKIKKLLSKEMNRLLSEIDVFTVTTKVVEEGKTARGAKKDE